MNNVLTYLKKEAKRILPLLLVAACVLVPDTGSWVVVYSLAITILVCGVSHLIRKLLFPYIDLAKYAERALDTPTGAAIVFASVSGLLAVVITSTITLLK